MAVSGGVQDTYMELRLELTDLSIDTFLMEIGEVCTDQTDLTRPCSPTALETWKVQT